MNQQIHRRMVIFLMMVLCKTSLISQSTLDLDTVKVYTFYIKGRTATGQHTTKIKQPFVAISRDLLQKYPLKSKIQLSDCPWSGVYAVLDIMGSKHNHAVDIYYKGRKRNVMKCSCSRVE